MAERADLERWVYGPRRGTRFTQDSPVMPEVWLAFGEDPEQPLDLLLTPHQHSNAARLMAALAECLRRDASEGDEPEGRDLALNEGYVVARLSFDELVRCAVPLSPWWQEVWPPRTQSLARWGEARARRKSLWGWSRMDWVFVRL